MPRPSRFHSAILRLVACMLLAAPSLALAQDAAPAVFQRVVLLGASATAGFEETEPLGGPKTPQYRFDNYIEAALAGPHEPVATQASALLCFQPEAVMEKQIAATVAARPTLVIGLDALFWFCYGAGLTAEQRMARLEAGLRQLERIDAPLIVGDIPDASRAVGGMLGAAEVPDVPTLARCNERLAAWAASRKNVSVFPLALIMAEAAANEELVLAGHTWEKGKSGALIRGDHLHPSRHRDPRRRRAHRESSGRAGRSVPRIGNRVRRRCRSERGRAKGAEIDRSRKTVSAGRPHQRRGSPRSARRDAASKNTSSISPLVSTGVLRCDIHST